MPNESRTLRVYDWSYFEGTWGLFAVWWRWIG